MGLWCTKENGRKLVEWLNANQPDLEFNVTPGNIDWTDDESAFVQEAPSGTFFVDKWGRQWQHPLPGEGKDVRFSFRRPISGRQFHRWLVASGCVAK